MTSPIELPFPSLLNNPDRHRDAWRRAVYQRDAERRSEAVEDAVEVVRDAPTVIRDILQRHRNEMASTAKVISADPGLNDTGRRSRQTELAAPIRRRNGEALAIVRGRVDAAARTLGSAIASVEPDPTEGAEGLLLRQTLWARAKTMLDAKMPWYRVLDETDDPEMVHALAEELPTWLRVQYGLNQPAAMQPAIDALRVRVAQRFADLAGSFGADARTAIDAQPHLAKVGPLLSHAEMEVAGQADPGHGLSASIAAEYAMQAAAKAISGSPWMPDDDRPNAA